MGTYIISIDIGTQGTKAALFDEKLAIIVEAFEASRLISPKPGETWQEADDIYASVIHVIQELLKKSRIFPSEVSVIGIDSQMAGIMGIDRHGEAVTYYDSWLDTRCSPYAKEMKQIAGIKSLILTGGPITCTHGPKILWWKNKFPELYKQIQSFVVPHAYVTGKMTDNHDGGYMDYTCIHYSGFGDNKNKIWSSELLSLFKIEQEKMPHIISPFQIVGKTSTEFSSLCGLGEGIPVIAGCGDTAASVFGAGLFKKGTLLDCAGTASVLCGMVDQYIPDTFTQTLSMMRSPEDGVWYPLAYINGGGMDLHWMRELFGYDTYSELEREAALITPGSDGLLFIPHFAGRILPSVPEMRGGFAGLTWKHRQGHLFRATMEAIAYEYSLYLDSLRELYPEMTFKTMYSIGGGAKSSTFIQIKSDVLGVNTLSFQATDTALLGTAAIAGTSIGLIQDYKKAIQIAQHKRQEYFFDQTNHDLYKLHCKAYASLLGLLSAYYQSADNPARM